MNTRTRRIAAILGAVAVLALALVPVIEAQTDYRFIFPVGIRSNNTGAGLFVRQDGSGSIATFRDGATDEYTFDQSSATFVNALTLQGGASMTGHLTLATAAPAALVTGTAVAPAAVLQPVSIATAGTVPITVPSAGRIVCVWNTGSQAVTFSDSGNQVLAGNFAAGQYDVICGISDGTRFIEITRSNN